MSLQEGTSKTTFAPEVRDGEPLDQLQSHFNLSSDKHDFLYLQTIYTCSNRLVIFLHLQLAFLIQYISQALELFFGVEPLHPTQHLQRRQVGLEYIALVTRQDSDVEPGLAYLGVVGKAAGFFVA